MESKQPRNPVFAVDPGALHACLPKVACPACGTIIALTSPGRQHRLLCPACGEGLQLDGQEGTAPLAVRLSRH